MGTYNRISSGEEMTTMRKVIVCALVLALIGLSGSAFAQGKVWNDLSWWGQSGATPAPVKDDTRSGYWWWPTVPASNVDDAELWGNRGVVYAQLGEAAEVVTPPVAPPPAVDVEPRHTIPVFSNVLFDFDRSTLRPEGKETIDKVIAEMNAYPGETVVLEGHTDSIGTDEYNMALGQRRANSVMEYMLQNGVSQDRIATVSYGESRPAVPNTSPTNRQLNRRVVFNISLNE
jgi:outer membrane protein OmpA-like peptidoglycan-associated protein